MKTFTKKQMNNIISTIREYLCNRQGWSDGFRAEIIKHFESAYVEADVDNDDYIFHILMFGRMYGCKIYFF